MRRPRRARAFSAADSSGTAPPLDALVVLVVLVVRTGVTGVGAAEPVDRSVVEQEPFGQAGPTRVDLGGSSEVQGGRVKPSPRERWTGGGTGGFRGVGAWDLPR